MSGFFSFMESSNTFQEFSLNHIIPLLLIVVGVVLIYLNRERIRNSKYEKQIRYGLAILAILTEVSFQVWQMLHGRWNFYDSLPLHLCRLTNYLGIYIMFTKNNKVFEIAYFWCLAGVVSILFPDILHGPDRFRYYHFMVSHILFFFNFLYLLFVSELRLSFKSYKKSLIALFLLATVIIIPINNIFGMNYMFLLEANDTPFSIFEGYGYFIYLVGCIGLTGIVMTLWYLPIYFYNKSKT
ncbi:Integral membrane protein [Candidatus Izimaplasma bacterium HR1]|jgi:hypothetical integral membrane protein (TIGR02206 family)|uniref:YwaF family protein n=1 Tax=Candidatus Izimoplasma sp. HR1 TaxID=1541959 RepID=UPI0004F5CE5E|nr:Integral membrane protein [Candidatus Izimaplasma bacterium HR1]